MYRVILLAAMLLTMTGCAKTQLELQNDSFNRASANTIGEQTLLNAVRASLDLPMSFTKLQKYTAEGGARGQLAPISDSIVSPKIFGLGPTLTWSAGVDSIEYVDVNTSGSLSALNKRLDYDAVERYVGEGLSLALLGNIFVQHVDVHKDIMEGLRRAKTRRCAAPEAAIKATCAELNRIADELKDASLSRSKKTYKFEGNQDYYTVTNTAKSKENYLQFQELLYHLRMGQFVSDLVHESTTEK